MLLVIFIPRQSQFRQELHFTKLLNNPAEQSDPVLGKLPLSAVQLIPHNQCSILRAMVGHTKLRCSRNPSSPASSSPTTISILYTCLLVSVNHTNLVVSLPQAEGLVLALDQPHMD